MGLCLYCGENKKLIKAHVLPRHFYTGYKESGYGRLTKNSYSKKRSQSGFYDTNILCETCDGIFGQFDDEAYKLLKDIDNKKTKTLWNGANSYIYTQGEFDYIKIRNFFISLIWRASISKDEFTQTVNLGKYENVALQILKDQIDDDTLFKIVVFKEPSKSAYTGLHTFVKTRFDEKQITYTIYFDEYIAYIIVKHKTIKNKEFKIFEPLFLNKDDFIIIADDAVTKQKNRFALKQLQ